MSQTIQTKIVQYNRGSFLAFDDEVIKESVLALSINDIPVNSFICSWHHIDFLIIGYLFCEGWITGYQDLLSMEINDNELSCQVYIPKKHYQQKNNQYILSSGCGNKKQSAQYWQIASREITSFSVTPTQIIEWMKQFQQSSRLFQTTGGVHSVAMVLPENKWILEEDIGRHNALDKTIGHGIKHGLRFDQAIILTSGRITSDMVHKIIPLPLGLIISKSAPTNSAITLAEKVGITLIGFARGERFNVYSHPERVKENKKT